MNNIAYGFEILVIGFTIVVLTLLLLAFVLEFLGKINAPREKKERKEISDNKIEAAADGDGKEITHTVRPEIIAASMGAILFALDTKGAGYSKINAIKLSEPQNDMWSQAGRTRLLNLRQDFVLLRRGKFR
ncbi:MAG: OadG family transporter subunit [Bacillota bacterium]|nr:OadG family transporter subunit [Bacillota bacterium]